MNPLVIIRDHGRQPARDCPNCGALHDGLTGVSAADGTKLSELKTQPIICAECRYICMLDTDNNLRAPTSEELDAMRECKMLWKLLRAAQESLKQIKRR